MALYGHALADARWTRIVPPVIDTLLPFSGIGLIVKTQYPAIHGVGLIRLKNCFGVIIYTLWVIALDYRQARSQQARLSLAPVVLGTSIQTRHHTKIPLLG